MGKKKPVQLNKAAQEKLTKQGYKEAIKMLINAFAIAAIDNKVSEDKTIKIIRDTLRYIEYVDQHLVEMAVMSQMLEDKLK